VFGLARRVLNGAAEAEDVIRRSSFGYGINRSASTRPEELAQLAPHPEPRARVETIRSLTARRQREINDAHKAARGAYDMQHEAWDVVLPRT